MDAATGVTTTARSGPLPAPGGLRRVGLFLGFVAGLALAASAAATTVKIATAFDPQTMDPHALALLYHSRVAFQVYDSLVNRDEQFKAEPSLAVSWSQVDPKAWRFKLRQGVMFHDGTPFTVDDAVFSVQRALTPPSQRSFQLKGVIAAKKVDEQTLEIQLEAPDAVLPDKFIGLPMMSKAWSQAHKVEIPQDFNAKQETFAVRNANGTGPYGSSATSPTSAPCSRRIRTGGAGATSARATSTRSSGWRSAPMPPGWRRWSLARSTWCSTRRSRTWRG